MKCSNFKRESLKLQKIIRYSFQHDAKLFFSTNNTKVAQFRKAVAALQLPANANNKKSVDNDIKLKLYALFKQAESGPCEGTRPGMFDLVGRAKYDAWKQLGNMDKNQAMEEYIAEVTKVFDGKLPAIADDKKAEPEVKAAETSASIPVTTSPKLRSMSDIVFPRKATAPDALSFQTIKVNTTDKGVTTILLNRPDKGNAFNMMMFEELLQAWRWIKEHSQSRVVVLASERDNFSTGMELSIFLQLQTVMTQESCEARKREGLIRFIDYLQCVVSEAEACAIPVISAVSGHCIGGAIDMICATDLRYCTHSANFSVKEIDLAIVADMGTLQRLPRIVGKQQSAELAFTGRNFSGQEAEAMGLVLKSFATKEEMMQHVYCTAEQIAAKSPLTIRGVKKSLNFNENHSVQDSLEHIQLYNASMVLSEDLLTAATAIMKKQAPHFTKE